mmetsp:Transcript_15459/g.34119  ORF Transcript_15459/g.34119 Transcript_15459/m.34119 type:complete len:281 (+) Transcript_15459:1748-2590(+)
MHRFSMPRHPTIMKATKNTTAKSFCSSLAGTLSTPRESAAECITSIQPSVVEISNSVIIANLTESKFLFCRIQCPPCCRHRAPSSKCSKQLSAPHTASQRAHGIAWYHSSWQTLVPETGSTKVASAKRGLSQGKMSRNSLRALGHRARVTSTTYGAADSWPAAKHGSAAMQADTFRAKPKLSKSLSTQCQNPPLKRDTANIPNKRKKMTQTQTKIPNAGNAPSNVSTTSFRFGLRLINRSGRNARRIRMVFTAAKIDPDAVPRYAAATSITETSTTTKSS